MDSELKRVLDETHALAKDNHRMLRAIRRDQLIGFFSKIIIWIVVLVLPFYLYQQYVGPIIAAFSPQSSSATANPNVFGLPTTADFQNLINSYKARQ